jgi:hypothetical protein
MINNIKELKLHATIFGYDFSRKDKTWGGFYTVFSRDLTDSERFDMFFESLGALSYIKDVHIQGYEEREEWVKYAQCTFSGAKGHYMKYRDYYNYIVRSSKMGKKAGLFWKYLYPFWYNNHYDN